MQKKQDFTKTISFRSFTFSYILALSLIAVLSVGAHYVQNLIIENQSLAAKVINDSGRQRMLSQRIAWLSNKSDAQSVRDLSAAIDLFDTTHTSLTRGELRWNEDAPNAGALENLYFTGTNPLDTQVKSYIDLARGVLKASSDREKEAFRKKLEKMAYSDLLNKLNQAVFLYENNSDLQIEKIEFYARIVLIVVIVTLLLEAVFIFMPVVKRVSRQQQAWESYVRSDPVPGIVAQQLFYKKAQDYMRLAGFDFEPLSGICVEIQNIDDIHESFGAEAVSKLLNDLGVAVWGYVHSKDSVVGRIGFASFGAFIYKTELLQAQDILKRIKEEMKERVPAGMHVQLKLGAAQFSAEDEDYPYNVIAKARQNMV